MKKLPKLITSAIALAGLLSPSASVFASNPYGIEYTGGEPLSANNVRIDPNLIDGLTPLIKSDTGTVFDNPDTWEKYYVKNGDNCVVDQRHYIRLKVNQEISSPAMSNYEIRNSQYSVKVKFQNTVIEDSDAKLQGDEFILARIFDDSGAISISGDNIFEDNQCTTQPQGYVKFNYTSGIKVFIELKLELRKNDTSGIFAPDELYFGITDIDASQSYKILNNGNVLSKNNMYAKSAEVLQPTNADISFRNMFVSSGNYIYSQGGFNILNDSDIFVPIEPSVQHEGLRVVFGFAGGAGSGIQYYAKQYTVNYVSDKNGTISGISTEDIISGQNPSGSTSTPNTDYELDYWIADKDVTLIDGTIIKAGQPITSAQVKQVVVSSDLTFTAIHKAEPAIIVPNTGEPTGETNATLISISIIGVLLGALIIGVLPKLHRKKLTFDK